MTATLLSAKTVPHLRKMLASVEKRIAKLDVPRLENTPKRSAQAQVSRCELWNWEDTRDHLLVALQKLESVPPESQSPPVPPSVSDAYQWCGRLVEHPSYYTYVRSHEYRDMQPDAVAFRAWTCPGDRSERERVRNLDKLLSDIRGRPIPGFFPTPAPIARRVVEEARLFPNARVLEPSCGIGSLIDALLEAEAVVVDAYEINDTLAAYCKTKFEGLTPVTIGNYDFLTFASQPGAALYDCVVMNPPFENKQAYAHIQHALSFLKPGGRLVSIVPSNFKPSDLKGNIDSHLELLPSNSFNSAVESFRQTSVSVALLTIDKYT